MPLPFAELLTNNFINLVMYKMDKTIMKAQTFAEAEWDNIFPAGMPIGERLKEAWWLICMTYRIDHSNPPKLDQQFFSTRKHSR